MSAPTFPDGFPAADGYVGAQQAGLEHLARIANEQAADALGVPALSLPVPLAATVPGKTTTGDKHVRGDDPWSGGSRRQDAYDGSRGGRGPDRRHSRGRARGTYGLPGHDTWATKTIHALTATAAIVILAGAGIMVAGLPVSIVLIGYWMLGAFVITVCIASFVKGRRFTRLPVADGPVLALIPAYNEDPASLAECVQSMLIQTRPPDRIVVVDDGSRLPVVPSTGDPRVIWIRQENRGKRGAHVTALRQFVPGTYRFVITVDSDSRPHPDAFEHLLRAMSSRKVQAATGWLYIRNYAESWVARAADIDIGGSCVMMRASRSMIGALETTSGALAIYRSEILYDHIDEYAIEVGTGDDRWLAMRALLRGQVVGVAEAKVDTDMPPTLKGTYRQRLRWARSWWWMVPFAYARLSLTQLISPTYGIVSLAITPVILVWTVLSWVAGASQRFHHPQAALVFVASYIVVRYALSALYLVGRPEMNRWEKLKSFIIGTPAAVLLNLALLMPTRYIALGKLQDNRWQTRQSGAQA